MNSLSLYGSVKLSVSAKIIESIEVTMIGIKKYKEKLISYKGTIGFLIILVSILSFSITSYNELNAQSQDIVQVKSNSASNENDISLHIEKPEKLNTFDKKQIQCLTDNAYFEAGNQSTKGKIAVTNVVMNRVEDTRFPNTPCGVVYQRSRRVCQFSWVCEGKKRIRSAAQYAEARDVAEDVYLKAVNDVTNGSLFYHANYVNPRWNYRRVIKIGDHIFYRG